MVGCASGDRIFQVLQSAILSRLSRIFQVYLCLAYAFRGGYAERWTVFWLTAHFLNAAADLKEMGAEL